MKEIAKGVGPKLAQKIILELKGKLTQKQTVSEIVRGKINAQDIAPDIIEDVQTILQSLGYNPNEYTKAIEFALKNKNAKTSEDILKEALSMLSNI